MRGELITFILVVAVWVAAVAFDAICEYGEQSITPLNDTQPYALKQVSRYVRNVSKISRHTKKIQHHVLIVDNSNISDYIADPGRLLNTNQNMSV